MNSHDRFALTGLTAIVTGGTRGLGRAIAAGFLAAGANVVITGRKAADAERAAVELGAGAVGVGAHAGDPDSAPSVVATTREHFGSVDVVVNNAANSLGMEVGAITPAGLQKSLDVNLAGPLNLVQAALADLRSSEQPSILNVTTVGVRRPGPGLSVYLAAKAGLEMLTRTMALELASDGVRVNSIQPGPFRTDMVINMGEAAQERARDRTPLGRIAEPDEIAGAAIFLASPAASFVTGATLVVDGGMSI